MFTSSVILYAQDVSETNRFESVHTVLTFRYEKWRAVAAGILETAGATFLLLIAVKWFEAGTFAKALIASGGSFGLIISPLVVSFVGRKRWTASSGASHLAAIGASVLVIMSMVPILPIFVVGSLIAMAATASAVPLMTQIYQENYPEKMRGRLFSKTVMIRIGAAAVFSEILGRLFTNNLHQFRWLLLIFAVAFVFSWQLLKKCPSRPLDISGGCHPLKSWHYVREDRLFRYTLICWMLMGFANLMMYPLRVEYLANPKYGLALKVSLIALYTGVIPNCARLIMSPIWGWLFDHLNFFLLRVILNLGFALGILTFFLSSDTWGLIIGAVVFGISNAGGDVAWSLWVTKFAPSERVADYMAIHTFLTGLRGVIAPFIAFHLLEIISLAALGWVSAVLIFIASLMLLPEIRFGSSARPASALVEEVSE